MHFLKIEATSVVSSYSGCFRWEFLVVPVCEVEWIMDNAPGGEFKGERMLAIIKLARRSKEVPSLARGSLQGATCVILEVSH